MKNKLFLLLMVFAIMMLSNCYDPYYYDYVDAGFYTKYETYLVGEEVQFYNTSDDAQSYFWDFGDGENSTLINPKHTYWQTGSYEVKLNAYGRDGKDEAYAIIEIVDSNTPTKLDVLVQYLGTSDPVSSCPVDVYLNQEDWENFQNPIMSSTTGSNGNVIFSGLDPQIYYLDAFKSINDTMYYSNEYQGVATDILIANTTNYYDIFVELLFTASGSKMFIIRDIEKSSLEKRADYRIY